MRRTGVDPPAGQELQAEVPPTFLLSEQGNNQFAGKYTGFTQAGLYRIILHAEDNDGLAVRPVVIEVNAGGGCSWLRLSGNRAAIQVDKETSPSTNWV